jgi:hypothetical protein
MHLQQLLYFKLFFYQRNEPASREKTGQIDDNFISKFTRYHVIVLLC